MAEHFPAIDPALEKPQGYLPRFGMIVLSVAAAVTGCGEGNAPWQRSKARLHIWYDASGYSPPPSMIAGKARLHDGKPRPLLDIVQMCGGLRGDFEILSRVGEEVAINSSEDDRRLVRCVQFHVPYGFNAARAFNPPEINLDTSVQSSLYEPIIP